MCSCLYERPVIFCQKSSGIAAQVGKGLAAQLSHLYSYRPDSEDIESAPLVQPRSTTSQILILDRSFDLAGPLMHSYNLLSLIEDLLEGNPAAEIEDEQVAAQCFN